ncbi:MAG: S4 domain-containing protein, partial [Actinomycetota bacterium]
MGEILSEEVPEALVGERLDRVVAMIAEISRSAAGELIANSGVRVDGELVTVGKGRLRLGQTVSVDRSRIPRDALPTADSTVRFDVVYADDAVVVVDKPAGLVVHPG